MTENLALSVTISLTLASTLVAQEAPPGPAPELKKLNVLAGSFTGEGVVRTAADAKPLAWKARSTGQWVLNGHFLEERSHIDFPDGSMPPLQFRSFFGWDRETNRYVCLGASNMGPMELQPVHVLSPTEIVVVGTRLEDGAPMLDHGAYRFGKDGYEFVMQRIDAHGKTYEHVRGTFKLTTPEAAAIPADAAFKGEASPELGKLGRRLGRWSVTGNMVPAPGAPAVAISGIETDTLGFGGTTIVTHVQGDPIPNMGPAYEAWGFTSWDPDRQCYVQGGVNNMGHIGMHEGRMVGADTFVFTSATPHMGKVSAARWTLAFSGDALRATSDRLTETEPVVREFEATYKPAK